jgi:5-methylcytosine-specific restriction endonuclease McrA
MNKSRRERIERRKALKAWSLQVRTRDNFTCKVCGLKSKYVHAHHLVPKHADKELRHDIKNGYTLCFRCHKAGPQAAHQSAIWFSQWLKEHDRKLWNWVNRKVFKG